jgi:hypothetical protein
MKVIGFGRGLLFFRAGVMTEWDDERCGVGASTAVREGGGYAGMLDQIQSRVPRVFGFYWGVVQKVAYIAALRTFRGFSL